MSKEKNKVVYKDRRDLVDMAACNEGVAEKNLKSYNPPIAKPYTKICLWASAVRSGRIIR